MGDQRMDAAALMNTDICNRCGRIIHIGDFPFCPHGRGANTVIPDDIPGGQWFENGLAEPKKYYSKSARLRDLDAAGYQVVAKNAGPLDTICPRWDTVDLDGAAQLVQRGVQARQAKRDPRWPQASIPISVRILDGPGVKASDVG